MSNLAQFPHEAAVQQNKILGHWVGTPREEGSQFHEVTKKYISSARGSTFRCPHQGCGKVLTASRVTKKQVDPIKAIFFAVLGLAAAAALVYLLVHLSAILAPLGLAAWMVNGLFGVTGGAAVGSLFVGLKNFAAFLSSLGTDPAIDERIRERKNYLRSGEA